MMKALRASFPLALLAGCAFALVSCGGGGVAAALALGSGGGGGGGGGSNGSASIAAVSLEPAPFQSGDVRISFRVLHPASALVDLRVRYSLDGGGSFPHIPTAAAGSCPLVALTSSPTGVDHIFIWDSAADLTEARVANLRFRFTPLEGGNPIAQGAAESPLFRVDNSEAPRVSLISVTSTPSASALQGEITLEVDIEDAEEDPVDIDLRLARDGGAFELLDGMLSPLLQLPSGPSGAPIRYALSWDSTLDVRASASVVLRAFAIDVKSGPTSELGPFEVNNTPPQVTIDQLDPPLVFDVLAVDFTLTDEGADPIDVALLYSLDGSTPSLPATRALGRGGEGTSGLTSSALGEPHTFLWDAAVDLGVGSVQSEVRVMVRAVETTTALEVFSAVAGPFPFDSRLVATSAGLTPAEHIVADALERDGDGTLLFVDRGDPIGTRIRRFDPVAGTIVDVAGGGGDPGEGVPALQALIEPLDLAIAADGTIYFIEGMRVRRVLDPAGANATVETYAGGGGSSANGVDRLAAQLDPRGISIDPQGDLFIADLAAGPRVRRVASASGLIDSLVLRDGSGAPVVLVDLGDIEADGQSNLYFSEPAGHRVYFYDNLAVSKRTLPIAGTGVAGFSGDGGLATLAQLDTPRELTLDAAGGVIVHDSGNRRLRRIAVALIETVVGGGLSHTAGAPATELELTLRGMSARGSSDLFFAHSIGSSARISVLAAGHSELAEVLGQGGPAGIPGEILNEDFGRLGDLLALAGGQQLAVESERRILRIDRASGELALVAGSGSLAASGDGGPAPAAGMNPVAIATGPSGDLYIADQLNDRIRRIDMATGTIQSLALSFDPTTFPPPLDTLEAPSGVAVDPNGFLYIADTGRHRVLRADPISLAVERVAGTGSAGDSGDGGPAIAAELELPRGVFLDLAGNVYILDQGRPEANHMRVRRVQTLTGLIDTVAGGGALDPAGVGATEANLRTISDGFATGSQLLLGCFEERARGAFDPALLVRIDLGLDRATIDAGVLLATAGSSGDGVVPTQLHIRSLHGLASDGAGAIFFTEAALGVVRRYVH